MNLGTEYEDPNASEPIRDLRDNTTFPYVNTGQPGDDDSKIEVNETGEYVNNSSNNIVNNKNTFSSNTDHQQLQDVDSPVYQPSSGEGGGGEDSRAQQVVEIMDDSDEEKDHESKYIERGRKKMYGDVHLHSKFAPLFHG